MQRLNCLPCRRRKSKCDRAEPCLSCVLRGTEAYCYTDLEPPRPQQRQSTSNTTHAEEKDDEHQKQRYVSGHGKTRSHENGSGHRSTLQATTRKNHSPIDYGASSSRSAYEETHGAVMPQASIHKTLDSIENALKEVRRSVTSDSRQKMLSSWGPLVPWSDARTLFPEPDHASAIFHCFFTELRWYMASVDQEDFETTWARAEKGKEDLPRHRVALICAVMAFSLLLAPRAHPASRLKQKTHTDARWHIENARVLIDAHYQSHTHAEEEDEDATWKDLGSQDEMIGQLEAETVYCTYLAVAGLVRKSFFALGRAVRLGLAVHLFDESRWKLQSTAEMERRRCIAWDLIVTERWTAGHLGVQSNFTAQPRVNRPSNYAGQLTLPRNKMTDHIARIVLYTNSMPGMPMATRVQQCEAIGQDLRQYYDEQPPELQYTRLKDISHCEPEAARRASQALSLYMAYLFMETMRVRPFLMDATAPPYLRFASLQYSRQIIELMPQLIALMHNPWTSHPPSWSLSFIFIASTIFASVLLSRDSASASSPSQEKGIAAVAAHLDPAFWPNEDLEWFSSVIFDVVDTFDLVSQGAKTHTARTCKRLFVGLCSSRETLRKRFQERERERLQQVNGLHAEERRQRSQQKINESRKRPRVGSPSFGEQRISKDHARMGDAALRLSNPFDVYKAEDELPTSANNEHDNAHSSARNDSTGRHSASGMPIAYATDANQSDHSHTGVTTFDGNTSQYSTNNDPFSGISSFKADGSTSSDLNTPPDFANAGNSALDMIYLDPLEWAQLTAGLDSSMTMLNNVTM